jgi:hypothetical protein
MKFDIETKNEEEAYEMRMMLRDLEVSPRHGKTDARLGSLLLQFIKSGEIDYRIRVDGVRK